MRRNETKKKKKPSSAAISGEDRLSRLPDDIIYLILQKLVRPLEPARTSVLSKRWLSLWHSYPEVKVPHFYGEEGEKKRSSFLVATSKRLLHDIDGKPRPVPLILDSFHCPRFRPTEEDDFYQLLSSASLLSPTGDGSRSPIEVEVWGWDESFQFPQGTFLNCPRTKRLHLSQCDLTGYRNYNTCLDNLLQLHLHQVRVSQQIFPSCLAHAPRLEKLELSFIPGLQILDVYSSSFPSLKTLIIGRLDEPLLLQLTSAPLLQTFHFESNCKLNVVSSSSVPSLKFVKMDPEEEFPLSEIEDLISKSPSLESLHLHHWGYEVVDVLRISAPRLGEVTLSACVNKLQIDAPNLVSLSIHLFVLPININVVSVASNCRCVVDCDTREMMGFEYCFPKDWFVGLRKLLTSLTTHFHHLDFNLRFWEPPVSEEPFDWSEVECESSPPVVQHLKLGLDIPFQFAQSKQRGHTYYLDGFMWLCHPKTLTVARRPHSRRKKGLSSYICNQIANKHLRSCCPNGVCWRHKYTDVKVVSVTTKKRSFVTISNY